MKKGIPSFSVDGDRLESFIDFDRHLRRRDFRRRRFLLHITECRMKWPKATEWRPPLGSEYIGDCHSTTWLMPPRVYIDPIERDALNRMRRYVHMEDVTGHVRYIETDSGRRIPIQGPAIVTMPDGTRLEFQHGSQVVFRPERRPVSEWVEAFAPSPCPPQYQEGLRQLQDLERLQGYETVSEVLEAEFGAMGIDPGADIQEWAEQNTVLPKPTEGDTP